MKLSAQQRFNQALDESRETGDALREFVSISEKVYSSHSYSSGYLESMVLQLIGELPKKRRAELREQFYRAALELSRKHMVDTLSK
jgi:hypothetical protein